jgi:hypothetical protein
MFLFTVVGFSFNPVGGSSNFKVPARTELHEETQPKVSVSTGNYFSPTFPSLRWVDQRFADHLFIFERNVEHRLKLFSHHHSDPSVKAGFHTRVHSKSSDCDESILTI